MQVNQAVALLEVLGLGRGAHMGLWSLGFNCVSLCSLLLCLSTEADLRE